MNISALSSFQTGAAARESPSGAPTGQAQQRANIGGGSGLSGGGASIWDVLEKLAKLKQEAIDKADGIAKSMSADDNEATKAQKQRELAKATAFIEDIQKKIEKMTETAHTTSSSRL